MFMGRFFEVLEPLELRLKTGYMVNGIHIPYPYPWSQIAKRGTSIGTKLGATRATCCSAQPFMDILLIAREAEPNRKLVPNHLGDSILGGGVMEGVGSH
jgi:hypothetical protein